MSELNDSLSAIGVIADSKSWVWLFLRDWLKHEKQSIARLDATISFRDSWDRFKNFKRIILHWENGQKPGGTIVEQLQEIDPGFDIGDRLIVVTTMPTRSDVVYFNELGLRRVLRLRQRDKDLYAATGELKQHLYGTMEPSKIEIAWRNLQRVVDLLPAQVSLERAAKIEQMIQNLRLKEGKDTARFFDVMAVLKYKLGDFPQAEQLWLKALEQNSNYFRSYNGLVKVFKATDRLQKAFAMLQKMHELNRDNVGRLAEMGEIHRRLGQLETAEHFFKSALERDSGHGKSLNGLGAIRFAEGKLEASRELLAKSNSAFEIARELNESGIALVREGKFGEALEHYTKAQFVIPSGEKGPQILYNIGLCYSRWEKPMMAKQFLRLALAKEPGYEKALRLLASIEKTGDESKVTNQSA